MKCPKCGYVRQQQDNHVIEGVCPQCSIAYSKWKPDTAPVDKSAEPVEPGRFTLEPVVPFTARIVSRLLEVPEQVDSLTFWGRVGLYIAFFIWGWSFILGGIDWISIGGSFLHNANLPFHEFGHVLFSPFGRYMGILGGSLFQVLMPLGLMLAFILQRRDTFAASIMLWWCGQNFIDVSPYIADAPYRAIPLIRGMSEDYHDWGNLLSMGGTLDRAATYASLWFGTGVVLLLLSFGWGGYLLYRQHRNLGGF
ncbi:hypothetical protein GCM10011352_24920 [Marinobacterium zhoushanense]|uniref:Zinc ribbon domain-containing protein n=1 Tax=Marinobacterium zhoushanense TaxID=1679163 RepID=A0ABQ1KII2_9GAMM|nr:hypothetical protein [Marinobacterium zhoushanense]GGB97827.1 hypothetical protein GCM10011352_24920 [Marinobacterium zhoushanense]